MSHASRFAPAIATKGVVDKYVSRAVHLFSRVWESGRLVDAKKKYAFEDE